ncbi:MAG: translational GTPase TypA [Gemmatimonadetes bacterium]|nr:translational GTPase TypA [Gemmatimonadota bacterium]
MEIRNIAIVAHVDHGKTTLVDKLLRQTGVFHANQNVQERVMDSDPLERERGITILSKNASLRWGDTKINIVDTPGHADFGGEVERILRMVDGVLLLVDAVEGPMPQTRFVTRKALDLGLAPLVMINKVDRADARPEEVHDDVLELLMELDADERQLDAPFLYGSARDGFATWQANTTANDLSVLLDAIVRYVPRPPSDESGPFQMLISTIEHSPYLGRLAVGRIERGRVAPGDTLAVLPSGDAGDVDADAATSGKVLKVMGYEGLGQVELDGASAGEIVSLAGLDGVEVGKTIADPARLERLQGIAVEDPTISVDFMVNDSPFAGRSGKYVTGRQVRERLFRELERNVSLRVEETERPDVLTVSGRGELHLAILMETMRREGYEFQVSRPRVITRTGEQGDVQEPYEELVIDVTEAMVGTVMEGVGPRRAELLDMANQGRGMVRMRFRIPARGLFGYRSDFLTDTRGEGVMHHRFLEYGSWAGNLAGRGRGVLIADRGGVAVGYALFNLQERGTMFVVPGTPVYEGMIVGENARLDDMDVNVTKEKKLSNMRTHASDEMIRLEPRREVTLELALEYIADDELIEVSPDTIRLRKRELGAIGRRKAARVARARFG